MNEYTDIRTIMGAWYTMAIAIPIGVVAKREPVVQFLNATLPITESLAGLIYTGVMVWLMIGAVILGFTISHEKFSE